MLTSLAAATARRRAAADGSGLRITTRIRASVRAAAAGRRTTALRAASDGAAVRGAARARLCVARRRAAAGPGYPSPGAAAPPRTAAGYAPPPSGAPRYAAPPSAAPPRGYPSPAAAPPRTAPGAPPRASAYPAPGAAHGMPSGAGPVQPRYGAPPPTQHRYGTAAPPRTPGYPSAPRPPRPPGVGPIPPPQQSGFPGFSNGMPSPGTPSRKSPRIDPAQMPRPQVDAAPLRDPPKRFTYAVDPATAPPPPTCNTVYDHPADDWNVSPRYVSCSSSTTVANQAQHKRTKLPLSLSVRPLAKRRPEEHPLRLVDFGAKGPPRCERCGAFVSGFAHFTERQWKCHLCGE